MATLLEQGIAAAKAGDKLKARHFLIQVLKADDRSERAWLWLSEAVDTHNERIKCLEQVLSINPDNDIAQTALDQLNDLRLPLPEQSQALPLPPLPPMPVNDNGDQAIESEPEAERRPFRLATQPTPVQPAPQYQPVVQQVMMPQHQTLGFAPQYVSQTPETVGVARTSNTVNSAPTTHIQKTQTTSMKKKAKAKQSAPPVEANYDIENLPLGPVIMFGALSVTAVGGIAMLLFIAIFG